LKPYYSKSSAGWQQKAPDANVKIDHTIYLIGDAGNKSSDSMTAVLQLLHDELLQAGANSSIVFLGDNIYRFGLPDIDHKNRKQAERRANQQLDILRNYQGNIFFVPGNHDWEKGRKNGLTYIIRQEEYIESYLERDDVFFPGGGCPGPNEIEISKDIVLILFDTQWWLHKWEKPYGEIDGCTVSGKVDFLIQLEDAIKRNSHRKIVVASHHPIYSNGNHGGHFSLKDHLFPLTAAKHSLFIPLPILGSIYPIYRKYLGNIQDISHPVYKNLKKGILNAFGEKKGLIYAAGHEHSLQYFKKGGQYHIISGSGSKGDFTTSGYKASFTHSAVGFFKLTYYENGAVWMEVLEPGSGNPVYRQQIDAQDLVPEKIVESKTEDPIPLTKTVIAGDIYKAGGMKKLFLGRHYREAWQIPVEVKVINLSKRVGGLTPIKKGGGMQTKSLRLKGADGKQYVFRSIQKDPSKALPKILRKTFAVNIMQDQISASHPYGAITVPTFAEAVGVYHTNPEVVYIPTDDRLQEYKDEFGGMLALFEERPAGDQSDKKSFGKTKNAINTAEVLQKLRKNNHNKVDSKEMAKARLLDMFLNDWDRHEDQWRWAEFKKKGYYLFKPIPRDRDQVYFKFDGIIPWLANRKWAVRKLQKFDYDIRDLIGMNFNGRHVDRSFLTELSLKDWKRIAKKMQERLTDEVIEEAIKKMPPKIFAINGEEIIAKLKSRRDNLKIWAEEYYLILARQVDIVGSDQKEYFEVKRLNDEETSLTIYDLSDKGKKRDKVFERTFKTDETKEINLYGLDGKDEFNISGKAKDGIIIRVIGGKGDDKIVDKSHVKGLRKHTKIYDTRKGNEIKLDKEARNFTSDDKSVHDYNRKSFEYNFLGPLVYFGYNVDDGIYLGGGVLARNYGFRKEPFATSHKIIGNFSMATASYNFKYHGIFTHFIKKWDLHIDSKMLVPFYSANYFGMGNETPNYIGEPKDNFNLDYNSNFHKVRFDHIIFHPSINKMIGTHQQFVLGVEYEYFKIESYPGRFISSPHLNAPASTFESTEEAGVTMQYHIDNTEEVLIKTRGTECLIQGGLFYDINNTTHNYWNLESEFTFYFTINIPFPTIIATRLGGATIIGDFEFLNANYLGGHSSIKENTNLRGFRGNRFSGRSSAYLNTEARIKLFNFQMYLFPGQFGVLAFADHGRVWVDHETSDKIHHGYGGGLWISPFERLVIKGTYSISEEDKLMGVNFGFLF